MNDLLRYLVDEIALDHADGILTRREALRRLGLMGLGAAAATSLLAACAREPAGAGAQASAPGSGAGAAPAASGSSSAASAPASAAGPPPGTPGLPTEAVTFAGPEGRKLAGCVATAPKPRGAVLVVHENKGLTEHFQALPGRFAAAGYTALAIDLLSEEGGTASLGDPAKATAALGKIAPERFVADMRAGLDELARRAPGVKLGAVGFCFGGGMMWRLVLAKDERLAAAAPFYGPLPDGADFSGCKSAVLAVYAANDTRVNGSRQTAQDAMLQAKMVFEVSTLPGCDHAFFNDTGPRYAPAAAAEAWGRLLAFFGKHVG